MKLSRKLKIVWAAAILWPILWLALGFPMFFRYMDADMHSRIAAHNPSMPSFFLLFPIVFLFHMLAIVCTFAMTALSIAHLVSNQRLSVKSKAYWAGTLALTYILAAAVYWYQQVRPEPPAVRESPNE